MPILNPCSRIPVKTLQALSTQPHTLPTRQTRNLDHWRHYAGVLPNAPLRGASVAILGGGITGLVSAYYLSRLRSDLQITLFESSDRLGGWLHSTSVDVGTGKVVFEQGPRNLRPSQPNGTLTLDLVDELGLSDRLLMTSKSSPAAQNRFIYYPDHLVRMPGPGMSLWGNLKNIVTEPVFNGSLSSLLFEPAKPEREPHVQDESVGSFISRRFSSALADNIVSAVFHGIYAGDIYKLSARSLLPSLWLHEDMAGSVSYGLLRARIRNTQLMTRDDVRAVNMIAASKQTSSEAVAAAKKSSVFTFRGGIGELANRLEEKLRANPNVQVQEMTIVEDIEMKGHERNAKIECITQEVTKNVKKKALWEFSHVISTISGSKLASIVSDRTPLLSLFETRAVTVMVVNLFYSNPSIVPNKGFGYLLPRSLPFDQNPERALGVVFDSDASIGQDAVTGTKLTVMLGGHWWDDFDTYPDEEEGANMAKAILTRHLHITESPRAVRVSLQKNCIPQYEVGHDQRMEQASKDLEVFGGRMRVAGSSYTGVGLNDCVRAATDCVFGLVGGTNRTGLEDFVGGKTWVWVER